MGLVLDTVTVEGNIDIGGNLTKGGSTINLPTSNDTIVLLNEAQTLTNKTLSGASNTFSNISTSTFTGTLQAAQFPALTGHVTTIAGSLATTIGTGVVTNAMLAGSIAFSKLVGTDITAVGTLTNLTVTNPISGSITGNAATATALQTARAINGVDFNGTVPITITAAAGTLTGTTLNATVVSSSLTSVGTLTNLTVTNPINGSITGSSASTTGNAATATALQTPRAINGVNFDGTAPITITAAAGTLTGTTLNSTVVSSSLTSVGTLTNLTVTNPISGSITGNAATVTTNANLTGPITSVGNATSVTNNAITNAMLAQVATQTFKGRTTAATGNVEDLTATQATAILNVFGGDAGAGGVKGLVPATVAGDATKYLKGDGTWGTIASGGTVTSVSVTTANGISGSVATATTTPAITLSLGDITPTTVNKVTITAPATGSTITITDGKTLTASNTLTFTGTDGSSVGFGTGGTVGYLSNKISDFAAVTSAELLSKVSDKTGSGSLVFATSPTLITPVLGVATATRVNNQSLLNNFSTALQTPTAATRTYITGSDVAIPANKLQIGTMIRWTFDITKTNAGTAAAASFIDIAFGTAGTTADTARVTFDKPAGTAVVDNGMVVVTMIVRGPLSASGVVAGHMNLTHNLASTGIAKVPCVNVTTISAAFDVTTPTFVGLCMTTGTGDVYTIQQVITETWNL